MQSEPPGGGAAFTNYRGGRMGACGGVMGGAMGRGNNAMSFKTHRGGRVWGRVFCVKAVCNCVGYIVVGRL